MIQAQNAWRNPHESRPSDAKSPQESQAQLSAVPLNFQAKSLLLQDQRNLKDGASPPVLMHIHLLGSVEVEEKTLALVLSLIHGPYLLKL